MLETETCLMNHITGNYYPGFTGTCLFCCEKVNENEIVECINEKNGKTIVCPHCRLDAVYNEPISINMARLYRNILLKA